MPTWRPETSVKNPIDLDKLNSFCKEHNILFIIKNHPFTREGSFYESVIDANKYYYSKDYSESILFYPTTDDIYPILSISDALITDYSSVYFDYLLLNKPIIFFVYDYEDYIKNHGDFMLDFDDFTPGVKPKSFEELKQSILDVSLNDKFESKREILKNELFENTNKKSCELLANEIKHLFEREN